MKKTFLISLLTLVVFTGSIGISSAQTKIATVDMKKLLDKYYKKTVAEQALKDKQEGLNKDGRVLVEELNKIRAEYDKALTASYDQSVTPAEREKRKTAAENKLAELQTQQKSIRSFEESANENMDTLKRRMLDKIVEEIKAAVNAKAKASGCSLVLDVSGESLSQVPVVLYNDGQNDITEAVLSQLNAMAPAVLGNTNSASSTTTK